MSLCLNPLEQRQGPQARPTDHLRVQGIENVEKNGNLPLTCQCMHSQVQTGGIYRERHPTHRNRASGSRGRGRGAGQSGAGLGSSAATESVALAVVQALAWTLTSSP